MTENETVPETVDELVVEIPEEGKLFEATITAIEMTTAGEVYGEKAKKPEKAVAVLRFAAPGIEGSESMGYAPIPHKRSNLYAHVVRYGKAPFVGQRVQVKMDEQGFWRIAL
jgi:uncharacterized OB-fold protein